MIENRLAVIQDDANFVAVIEPTGMAVESIPLPAVASGQRQFDDLRGNRHDKLDLEVCTTISENGCELLLAMASGGFQPVTRVDPAAQRISRL